MFTIPSRTISVKCCVYVKGIERRFHLSHDLPRHKSESLENKSFITKDGGSYTASSLLLSLRGNCLPARHYSARCSIQAKCRSSRKYNYNDAYFGRYEILPHRLRQADVPVSLYCGNNSILFGALHIEDKNTKNRYMPRDAFVKVTG